MTSTAIGRELLTPAFVLNNSCLHGHINCPAREFPQFVVNERQQLRGGLAVAGRGCVKETGDVGHASESNPARARSGTSFTGAATESSSEQGEPLWGSSSRRRSAKGHECDIVALTAARRMLLHQIDDTFS